MSESEARRILVKPSPKDENGIYTIPSPEPEPPKGPAGGDDKSIDDLLSDGLLALRRNMHYILLESTQGILDRETVMSLKDCINLLLELKKKEDELLDGATEEELAVLAKPK